MGRLFLFDGTALAYRAFYALDRALSTSSGIPTNATYGVAKMLVRFIKDHVKEGEDYLAFAFDKKTITYRHTLLETYKAKRPKTPDLMLQQLPYIKRLVNAMGIKVIELEGYEADDVIATLALRGRNMFDEVLIITGDKDMLQLVDDKIKVWRITRGITDLELYDAQKVKERYGVLPSQMVDYLSLVGDEVDNVPGVTGIGEKTAIDLLEKYGSMEKIYENLSKLPERVRKALIRGKKDAQLSKKLVTLVTDIEMDIDWEELRYKGFKKEELLKILKELEFSSIMRELDLFEEREEVVYKTVKEARDFEKVIEEMKRSTAFSIDLETTSLNPYEAKIVGIAVSTSPKRAYYIPVGHREKTSLDPDYVLKKLKEILEDPSSKIMGQNLKYDYSVFALNGIYPVDPFFDTMIAAYLLDPNEKRFNLDELALKFLGYKMIPYEEVAPATSPLFGFSFADVSLDKATRYACEDADIVYRLFNVLNLKLHEMGLMTVFEKIELPLIPVLSALELNGVYIDTKYLEKLSREYGRRMDEIASKVFELAGETFNLNSPKQVGRILFEKLGITPKKKTRTGDFSTSVDVLEELAMEHEIVRWILEYRKYQKLKSTYIDALPKLVNPKTKRIHASFHQTGTATGRLSSSDPNLQNLPTRNDEGKEIRKAIVPQDPNWWIVSADYSQIELRVLAHFSKDENLLKAFETKEDIHSLTASKIFGVPIDKVTSSMRRIGKMVNFSIIYGVTPYGLAMRLKVPVKEAEKMITSYFNLYPKVREFIQRVVSEARSKGFVRTLFGRRRDIPQLKSRDRNVQGEGERIAINTPIQGTAADIMKLAMIEIHKELGKRKMKSKMIIQVHDELVFEVPDEEKEELIEMVRDKMENVVKLSVPLEIDVSVGKHWE
ncbi:MAG: DNA polymerase I [Thermotoga sp.]|nr:MAG: DNA polymerase I [Thermotoga sp.]